MDYICTNFFFEIVHKKGKTFGPDGLSRRKWYPGDPPPEEFTDGTDDGAGDIVLRKDNPQEPEPLKLEEFYEEIDSREGFLQEILRDDGLLSLEMQFTKDSDHSKKIGCAEIFTETVETGPENSLETDREEYDDNRRSESAKRLEDRLIKVRELLAVRGAGRLETLSAEQASLVRTSSHYWLDKEDSRLYKKNTENNGLQLVVVEENRMCLLKSCHDDMGHRGAYATGKLLQQRFWWPGIEEDVIWYVRTCHLCQIR